MREGFMKKFGYVLAPKVLVANKLKVRFMYREKQIMTTTVGGAFFQVKKIKSM